jgi:hypothetical protein
MRILRLLSTTLLIASITSIARPLRAQTDGLCVPESERASRKLGCFIIARHELGRLLIRPPLYWHLDVYTNRDAAQRAQQRDNRSRMVDAFGKIWLFTIAPFEWKSPDGELWARVGPLPLLDHEVPEYAAVYMEGVFEPGMRSIVHRHPGAEAWFTLEGSMCVETPEGKQEQSAGEPGIVVPGGLPMVLTGTGTGVRRSLVLILQDATKPRSTPAPDWTPKNLCRD